MKLGPPALAALLVFIPFGVPVDAALAAAPPRAEVRGVTDPALRQKIQQAVGDARAKPNNKTQARRRAEDAAESAAEALRSEGYYAFTITPDVSDETQPQGVLKIVPGPQFRIAGPAIDWIGAVPDPTAATDAFKALDLAPGQPGRAPDVLAAEGRVLAQLKKHGYADAKAEPRKVVADFATDSLVPTFRIDAGPVVKLDDVRVTTKGRTHPSWVERLAPWSHGQAYNPDTVAELERRLNDTGVYQSVTVALAPASETEPDGLRPVDVTLVDRAPVSVQLGASYSTAEGLGLASALRFYNRLGMADTVSLIANVAQIENLVGVQLSLPHVGRPDQTLAIEPDF